MSEQEKEKNYEFIKEQLRGAIGYIPPATEEDFHPGYEEPQCPYNLCDGRGYTKTVRDGHTYTTWCKCYEDRQLKLKMKSSHIESKYYDADFVFDEKVYATLLQPVMDIGKPMVKKVKTKEVVEGTEEYIARVFQSRPVKKGVNFFAEEFSKITLAYESESPRVRSKNLILIGEPGRGKTHLVCAMGKEFLRAGKTVHFTTMQKMVNDIFNPEIDIREITKTVDLLIIDELGGEYHTEKNYALTQIKEMLRARYNAHLPVVSTTNFYPNELAELYDPSLMSMFAGSYLFVLMQRDDDYRLLESEKNLDDFTFLED